MWEFVNEPEEQHTLTCHVRVCPAAACCVWTGQRFPASTVLGVGRGWAMELGYSKVWLCVPMA